MPEAPAADLDIPFAFALGSGQGDPGRMPSAPPGDLFCPRFTPSVCRVCRNRTHSIFRSGISHSLGKVSKISSTPPRQVFRKSLFTAVSVRFQLGSDSGSLHVHQLVLQLPSSYRIHRETDVGSRTAGVSTRASFEPKLVDQPIDSAMKPPAQAFAGLPVAAGGLPGCLSEAYRTHLPGTRLALEIRMFQASEATTSDNLWGKSVKTKKQQKDSYDPGFARKAVDVNAEKFGSVVRVSSYGARRPSFLFCRLSLSCNRAPAIATMMGKRQSEKPLGAARSIIINAHSVIQVARTPEITSTDSLHVPEHPLCVRTHFRLRSIAKCCNVPCKQDNFDGSLCALSPKQRLWLPRVSLSRDDFIGTLWGL